MVCSSELEKSWWWSCSQVEGIAELSLGEVSLVVNLHLFLRGGLGFDGSFVVLKGDLHLHAGASVRGVRDEASFEEFAAIGLGCLEVEHNVARLFTESCLACLDGGVTLASLHKLDVGIINLHHGPTQLLASNLVKSFDYILRNVGLLDHFLFFFLNFYL